MVNMKRYILAIIVIIFASPLHLFSQSKYSLDEVCDLMDNIGAQIENGINLSSSIIYVNNELLKSIQFSPIPENIIKRRDQSISDSSELFLYLPEYIDTLLQNEQNMRVQAERMYNKFKNGGNKGSNKNKFLQMTFTILTDSTAVISIPIKYGEQCIGVLAQPFGRISVSYYENGCDVTGIDPDRNKGYRRAPTHCFYKKEKYLIDVHVKNLSKQDISFTIIAD